LSKVTTKEFQLLFKKKMYGTSDILDINQKAMTGRRAHPP
jgi:hypothetical protein